MKTSSNFFLSRFAVLLALLLAGSSARAQSAAEFRGWGIETLTQIETEFALPQRHLYADKIAPGQPAKHPAFMWGCGVELSALVAASKVDGKMWKPRLKNYFNGLNVYWQDAKGTIGYNVLPMPSPPDRYYDDNEWIAIALCDAYDLTKEKAYLTRAEETMTFILSAEDDKFGGGIYWKEEKKSKNTCSNGPAIVGALRLYQVTGKHAYFDAALRIYRWTNLHLQDTDGLYFDNVNASGKVEKMKWTYNTALMLRANCLFYTETRNKIYLAEAQRIAKASEAHWFRADTGAINDPGIFAHLLCEAFLALYQTDHNPHWRTITQKALQYVHSQVRSTSGYYSDRWEKPNDQPITEAKLIQQASAARAFLVFANGGP